MKPSKTKSQPVEREANLDDEGEAIWKDGRFAHLLNDPRFRGIPKTEKRVRIDKRFQSMFNDPKFEVKYSYDKYGRKVKKSSANDLKKFYEIKSDEEEEDAEPAAAYTNVPDGKENDELDIPNKDISVKLKQRLRDLDTDYARGEGFILTDSSSDDDSGEEDGNEAPELFIDHVWGELDRDAPMTDDSSRRLAVCNMDWDKMRADDIMVLCNSFLPPNSAVLRVAIYPSEYGRERMREEEKKGPQELVSNSKGSNLNDGEDSSGIDDLLDDEGTDDTKNMKRQQLNEEEREGDGFFMEKLRQYQLNRLKYYYAVIECDSISTADKLYAECDGLEYESSATKLDLRFIPDDMEFEDDPREECTEMPDLANYAPRMFQTGALQNAKVDLTWDETAEDRKEFAEKLKEGKLNTISDAELKKYLACSSSDEDDEAGSLTQKPLTKVLLASDGSSSDGETDPTDAVNKYRNLLAEIKSEEEKKKNRNVEMEFSWDVKAQTKLESNDKDNGASLVALTPFEKLIEKQKKKKELRKNKKKVVKNEMLGESDSDVPDGIDMNDSYFAEEFATGDFAPKKAGSMTKDAKGQRKEDEEEQKRQQAGLALLLDDDDKSKAHFSLKKIQKSESDEQTTSKRKRKRLLKKSKVEILGKMSKGTEVDGFVMDMDDDRFAAIYSSHLYNIDPTDPNFKRTKIMEKIITEKQTRKTVTDDLNSAVLPKSKKSSEQIQNLLLVNKLKRKLK